MSILKQYDLQFRRIFTLVNILFIFQIVIYIILKQTNRNGNNYMLWFSVIAIILIILLQIFLNHNIYIILVEIITLSFLLHILFIPIIGLEGSDAQYDFHLTKLIAMNGWSLKLNSSLAPWPAIHLFMNISSEITGFSLLEASRYFPSAISVIVLFFMFCLSKHIYKQNNVALIYTLLFSFIFQFIYFHSHPIRESFAFVILFAALYSYIRANEQNNFGMSVLAVFFGLFLLISHHFTLAMYIFFLIIFILYSVLKKTRVKYTYPTMIIIASISYWIFVSYFVFRMFVTSFDFISFGEVKTAFPEYLIYPSLNNILTRIHLYSKGLTFLTGTSIIAHSIILERRKLKNIEYPIVIYSFFILIVFVLITFGVGKKINSPERFELFAWAFGLIFFSQILIHNFTISKKLYIKIVSFLFLISFITMNISINRPDLYDPSIQPPYENGGIRTNFLSQEYSAVTWFKGDGLIQSDRVIEDLLIHDIKGQIRTDPDIFNGNLSKIKNNNYLIIRKEMYNRIIGTRNDNHLINKPLNISIDFYNLINEDKNIRKIYSNREVEIYFIQENRYLN